MGFFFFQNKFSLAGAFLALLRDLGKAYLSTQMYDNQKAIKEFESVQHHQYKTGWVLAEIGKAYLEMAEYTKVGSAAWLSQISNGVLVACLIEGHFTFGLVTKISV